MFEYELPLNFKHECNLTPTFYAVQGINDHYFGFNFESPADKQALTRKMK